MTISIGTFSDLKGRNEPAPIDRDPHIKCSVCGSQQKHSDWEDRYESIDAETEFICWDCYLVMWDSAIVERRKQENAQLTDYTK